MPGTSRIQCPNCQSDVPAGTRFCAQCGTPVRGGRPEAELRQITVLFCDLVGSTALADVLDPEDLREIEGAHHAVCSSVISGFEGHVAQYIGDGIVAYFGYPFAHEDDARRAVQAGLGILDGMQTLNTRLRAERHLELSVRLGIHTGPVIVGEVGDSERRESLALGKTLHLAARVQTFAQPGTVVVSDQTFRIVSGYFDFEPLGAHQLKGLAEPVVMHRVLRVSGAESRLDAGRRTGLTALTGRSQELAMLEDQWRSVAEGRKPGHTVLVTGEAGIGKSRIVACLRETIEAQSYRTIACFCSAYSQSSPLYPIIAWIERSLGFNRETPEADKWPAIEQQLDRYGIQSAESVQLVAQLLGVVSPEGIAPLALTPQLQRERALDVLGKWLMAVAREGPTLVIVEDLHWSDPTTLEFVKTITTSHVGAPLLTILTYRTGFEPPFREGERVSVLPLGRLGRDETSTMIIRVAKDKALPERVLRQLIERTEGVPLFVEEVTKAVLELGVMVEGEERYELGGPVPPDLIPATVQGSLLARLDRLGSAKPIAQVAATIGRDFRLDVLRAVTTVDDATLSLGLDRLLEAGLIFQVGGAPDITYVFKHALIQDAAYQSLLKKSRREQHRRIGETLALRFPDVAEQRPELVAQHFASGGDPDRAVNFWQRAGRRALGVAANHEAIAHITRALEQLSELPLSRERDERELECNIVLTPALQMTQGWASPDVERTFHRSVALVDELGDSPHRFMVLANSFAFHLLRGQISQALSLAKQVLELATHLQQPTLMVVGNGNCCVAQLYHGDIGEAIQSGETALELLTPEGSQWIAQTAGLAAEVYISCYLCEALWMRGCPEQAVLFSEQALASARQMKHWPSLEFAVGYQAEFYHLLRDHERVLATADESFRLGVEYQSAFWNPMITAYKGWALSAQGQHEEGVRADARWPLALSSRGQRSHAGAHAHCPGRRPLERRSSGRSLHDTG